MSTIRSATASNSFPPDAVGAVPTADDVARLALRLPSVEATDDPLDFGVRRGVKASSICWSWKERVDPRRARVRNPGVLAVRVPDLATKEELLAADPDCYFTEAHYDGYPAVLVRLDRIGEDELGELLTEAWRSRAPAKLVREFDRDD
jgi:hypothetical protein